MANVFSSRVLMLIILMSPMRVKGKKIHETHQRLGTKFWSEFPDIWRSEL